MDSLIHYESADAVRVLAGLADRTERAVLFTYAPSNPALMVFRAVGRLFPRDDRAPWIEPVAQKSLYRQMAQEPRLSGFAPARTERISSGFYTSQALELKRAEASPLKANAGTAAHSTPVRGTKAPA
jgi:magnesium-protoporphyrin O-methyltransferase